jgi:hypothetical protein
MYTWFTKEMLNINMMMEDMASCSKEPMLADCKAACPPAPTQKCGGKKRKTNMYDYDCDCYDGCGPRPSTEEAKFNYLDSRAYSVRNTHDYKLERQFGMRDDADPETAEEMIERIKAGKYQLIDKKDRGYRSAYGQILWRDPSIEKDPEGYRKAAEALSNELTKTRDAIRILSPEAGLAALQAFESWSFTAA